MPWQKGGFRQLQIDQLFPPDLVPLKSTVPVSHAISAFFDKLQTRRGDVNESDRHPYNLLNCFILVRLTYHSTIGIGMILANV